MSDSDSESDLGRNLFKNPKMDFTYGDEECESESDKSSSECSDSEEEDESEHKAKKPM